DDVRGLVHDDHAAGAERRLLLAQTIEVHHGSHHVLAAHDRTGGATGDHRQEVVPAAANATAVLLDDVLEALAKGFFEGGRLVDVPGHHKQLGAGVVRAADRREPGTGAAQDLGHNGNRLDVVDRGRVAVDTHARRERRLQARLALLALERPHQRGFFAADVSAGTVMNDDVQVPAVDVVL